MPKVELLKSLSLPDFPSGSSVNYRDEKLFLIGDDANAVLVMDKNYRTLASPRLFDFSQKRIPKPEKVDLESAAWVHLEGKDYLLVIGSASTPQREKVLLIPYSSSGLDVAHFRVISDDAFIRQLNARAIPEVNLEGATVMHDRLLLSNRANQKNRTNHLLVTKPDFWKEEGAGDLRILPIELPLAIKEIVGVSEMCYADSHDILFLTLSTEMTDSAYGDGAIGDSYLGWCKDATRKIQGEVLIVDQLTNLPGVHPEFKNQKIEGVCVESVEGEVTILHLVSDNDQGESKVFKIVHGP